MGLVVLNLALANVSAAKPLEQALNIALINAVAIVTNRVERTCSCSACMASGGVAHCHLHQA